MPRVMILHTISSFFRFLAKIEHSCGTGNLNKNYLKYLCFLLSLLL
uniref:Uncharacterized protein n=1 Tax=Rhizophora mucronata TaxID=61149 RepID=A0A2P2P2T0_RHIMU